MTKKQFGLALAAIHRERDRERSRLEGYAGGNHVELVARRYQAEAKMWHALSVLYLEAYGESEMTWRAQEKMAEYARKARGELTFLLRKEESYDN